MVLFFSELAVIYLSNRIMQVFQEKTMVYFHITLFLACQIVANLLFKWGAVSPSHYWWGFALGNAVGITSILFMMGMYRHLPAANVVAIGTGGTFILIQLAMYLVFREKIQPMAILGFVLIVAGVLLVAYYNNPREIDKKKTEQTISAGNPSAANSTG